MNLKLFLSISLGLHLLVFSLLSILLPDWKITQLPRLNIEVSLLSIAREERELPKRVEHKLKVRSLAPPAEWSVPGEWGVRSEGKEPLKIVEKTEVEIKTEAPTSVEIKEEKKIVETEQAEIILPKKQEEPVSTTSVQSEVKAISVSEPKPSPLQSEKKEIENKQEERVVVASIGNRVPQTSSSEKPRVAMKSPSFSESKIVFAQPQYAENPNPLYPREARKKGYEGEVLLRVEVLSSGRVGEIEVRRSSGHEVLDRSAIQTVKQWRFVPAKEGETPISVWVNIPVAFKLR